MPVANKNYMSIAVSVLTTSQVARKNGGAARQEHNPQSATAYSSVRYVALKKTTMKKLYLLIILVVLTGTIVIGQTRCDTISDDIFGVTEEMPTLNISIDQLEDILNISIDLNKYSRPEGNAIYVNLIINCKRRRL